MSQNKSHSSTEYVKLTSSDGFEFYIERNAALISGTIKNMLSSPVHFRDITAVILEKVCQYLYYKSRYTASQTDIPAFPIEPNLALELLMVADFLDC
ncbi:8517_t:CDS:2 [Funneliformis caledonium]|uniref:Elongin-C n=2 Tax=Funneliformis TaxID=1117308 RepID=A0A9N9D6I8_9GLOM|nr:13399_t:CDS:2 [Funneliformis mosseae]CAG8624289.1 8517_t:CDS:2 [Funneliformis caledonium]